MRAVVRYVLIASSLVFSTVIVAYSDSTFTERPALAATSFTQTFDGAPTNPLPFKPSGWDMSIISHEDDTIDGMMAEHGPNCEPPDELWPGGQPNSTHNHGVRLVPQIVFQCANHIMTSMNAGYGAIYLTPPALLDFRNGASSVEWDMSTQRTSSRDWVDFVLLPFDPTRTDLQGPMALNMQDFHTPQDGLHIELQGSNVFAPHTFLGAPASGCSPQSYWRGSIYYCRFAFDGFNTWEQVLAKYGLGVSAQRRNHFKIEVSRTHLRVGFQPKPDAPYFYWVDTDIPGGGLRFDEAVIQLNHRAYNPLKPCGGEAGTPAVDDGWEGDCRANTWHWDNVTINPSDPFTIIPSDKRRVSYPGGTVTFAQPAPANSFIKAAGGWSDTQYSLDGGQTWRTMSVVGPKAPVEVGDSYWTAVPTGTQTVQFRGTDSRWSIQDIYLWSRSSGSTTSPPTATPVPATPTRTPTPVPTVGSGGNQTITFDDLSPQNRTLSGQYPTGIIDWGTNAWYLSGAYGAFDTNSIGFNGAGPTSASFTFVNPRRLIQIDAYNGSNQAASTVTLSCAGQPTVSINVPALRFVTIATGWTGTCSTVTVGSSNGWETNFDNLVIASAATATATPTPSTSRTIDFNDLTNPNRTLSGQYPTNVIDWGTNGWYLSGPFGGFRTNSIGFNGSGPTSASFTFVSPKLLLRVDAFNGGNSTSTITLSCAGQPTVTRTLAAQSQLTILTSWTQPCSNVTVGSSNGWNTNFDNLVIQ